MLTRLKDFVALHDLFDPEDRILLAVSGGLDSMVMLDAFRENAYKIGVAHCNFQLRGKDSDGDEAFVEHYCKQAGMSFYGQRFDTKNYAEETGLSIQMAARELRYTWFNQLLEKEKFHWVATAHHLNDNIETILLRWTKGAGLDQLMGIPLKNEKVIRPLLFATRDEISKYASHKKLSWREDSSNETDNYQRNFIRHQVVPKFLEINPSLESTFSTSLEKMKGAFELMQRGLGQLKDGITRTEGQQFFIDKSLLMLLQNPVFVCYEWLRPFGFEWDRCQQLIASVTSQPGKLFYSSTHQAVIDRECIIVSPRSQPLTEILIEEGQDKAALGPWVLTLKVQPVNSVSSGKDHGTFDQSKIKFPMVWRKWRSGDAFFPLGLGHRKKVSDFLVDEKVPLTEKSVVTILESDGDVVWVVGHRVDDRFKVTPRTKSVVQIEVAFK